MSLQRRLLIYLMLCAPVVWAIALAVSANRAQHEVNELFDTEIIRLALQVQATLPHVPHQTRLDITPDDALAIEGEADLRDLAIAAWDAQGALILVDREGEQLPRRVDHSGFINLNLAGHVWRIYYLHAPHGQWLVAAGQRFYEREELVWDLLASQLLPWLLVLPVLLIAMAWAVGQALAPLRNLTNELKQRSADDLQAIATDRVPHELQDLLAAMNGLFKRIDTALERERRFTADAAHELRTPLAVLRAQWDVLRGAQNEAQKSHAIERLGAGIERMTRLVTQLLLLSRIEAAQGLDRPQTINWPTVVQQSFNDVLSLAQRRQIELACTWPPHPQTPWPLKGDADLIGILLRNLLDNAVRYSPPGSTVTLSLEADALRIHNEGPPLSDDILAHLGERFHRPDGQDEAGSGLGISIAQRVAALHGLRLHFSAGEGGQGVRVSIMADRV